MTGKILADFWYDKQRYYVIVDHDQKGNELHICKVISVTRDDFTVVTKRRGEKDD